MRWVNMAVKPYLSWPDTPVELVFEGRRLVLRPLTDELAATVSVYDDTDISFEEGGWHICRFLSSLAWSFNSGIQELFVTGSNDPAHPGRLGRGTYGHSPCTQITPWDRLYIPLPKSQHAALALALYREGMSLNSVPFQFLSYFKIVNMLDGNGPNQIALVNETLQHVWWTPALDRLKELQPNHADIGNYLYVQGRCAVAHAHSGVIANPDKYEDKRRLEFDLPLMKHIAELFIEQKFGVLSDSSFWKATKDKNPENLEKQTQDGRIIYK